MISTRLDEHGWKPGLAAWEVQSWWGLGTRYVGAVRTSQSVKQLCSAGTKLGESSDPATVKKLGLPVPMGDDPPAGSGSGLCNFFVDMQGGSTSQHTVFLDQLLRTRH